VAPATVVLVAVAIVGLALDQGTFRAPAVDAVGVAVWWAIGLAVAVGFWPRDRPPLAALVGGGLLVAFAAWTGLSALWAPAAETALTEFNRVTLYVGILAIGVLASRRGEAARFVDGLALGLVAVGVLALLSRFFPDLTSTQAQLQRTLPGAQARLSYPVGYWNGLGSLVALGFPLLLAGASARRAAAWRALAVAGVPVLSAVIYLTSSRGGAAVAIVGAAAFLALSERRGQALLSLAVGGAGSAAAILILHARSTLVDGPLLSHTAVTQGRSAAALMLVLCLATGGAHLLLARVAPRDVRVHPRLRILGWAGVAALLIVGVVAADPSKRLHHFKQPPAQTDPALLRSPTYVESHLFSGGGSGRWQFWGGAVREFRSRPVIGRGAGTYEAWWARHGSITYFIRDAHSLWLETMGELGIVGLVLLGGAFGAALAAALARLRAGGPGQRTTVAALAATTLAFALGAALDWVWELGAVAGVAMLCLGLLTGPATLAPAGEDRRTRRGAAIAARVTVPVLAAAVVAIHALPLLADAKVQQSRNAAAHGNADKAQTDALAARRLEPWSSTPPLQLALVHEQEGDLASARAWIERALGKNDDDWRLWLVAARIETKQGDLRAARESLARARRLNPRSPLLRLS
jgi:hypothetical protein